jgi:phenylacetate-CoA ligase
MSDYREAAVLIASRNQEELCRAHRADVTAGLLAHAKRLRWSKSRIESERQDRLRHLLAYAVEHSPFHADRLAGIDPTSFTEEQLTSLPSMTKEDLMSEFSSVVTDARLTIGAVEDHVAHVDENDYLFDRFRAVTSSGSSGRRGVFVYDWDEWTTLSLMLSRPRLGTADNHPRPPGSATASLFAGEGAHLTKVLRTFLAEPGDPLHHLPMTLPVADVVRGLNETQPELLMGYPSAIDLVVREAQAGRLRISPRYVETGGELLMEKTRLAVRELWGVEIDDSWAVVEGAYAYSCSAGQVMHLADDLVIIEPVDLAGQPVAPGEPAAKLYLTNLYNLTQPLIRFEIADGLTLFDDACSCGSAHRRIANLTGRADIVFDYAGGVRVHPMVLRIELHEERHVTEYQVRQTTRGLSVKVVTERPDELNEMRDRLVRTLQTAGLRDPEVDIEAVGRLERLAAGKLRQFIPRLGG